MWQHMAAYARQLRSHLLLLLMLLLLTIGARACGGFETQAPSPRAPVGGVGETRRSLGGSVGAFN